jgi:hypothetical protein
LRAFYNHIRRGFLRQNDGQGFFAVDFGRKRIFESDMMQIGGLLPGGQGSQPFPVDKIRGKNWGQNWGQSLNSELR